MADQRFAIIRGETVINVQMAEGDDRIALTGSDIAIASDEADIGFVYDGTLFKPPAPDASALVAYAAAKRYAKEVSGIVVSGIPVATDDRSKQMIIGARIAAEADNGFTTPWVGADGSINTLNAAQAIAVSNAVLAHVAGCFATFASVRADIADETITTREEIDAAFAS